MKRWVLSAGTLCVVLALSELGSRQFIGNLGGAGLLERNPGGQPCVSLRPGARILYTGHFLRTDPVLHEVNDLGFRGRPIPRERATSTRVALIGDSFTYGVGVGVDQTFAVRIQATLDRAGEVKPFEIMNFGVPGLNLDEVREHYDGVVRRWNPDLVLYFMWNNDLDARFCDTPWGRLTLSDGLAARALRLVVVRLPYILYQLYLAPKPPEESLERRRERLLAGIGTLADSVGSGNAGLGVVVLGDPLYTRRGESARDSIRRRGIPVLDLEALAAEKANRLSRDFHLSPEGHGRVADAVTRWMRTLDPAR